MILLAPCIIDFIGANGLRGSVGGRGPGHSWALKWHERTRNLAHATKLITTTFLLLKTDKTRYLPVKLISDHESS